MSAANVECHLSPEAERDLESIWLYTYEQWSHEQADRYIDRLLGAFHNLAESPNLGESCEDIREGYRRYRVGRHVIYYRTREFGVSVIRVLHERMLSTRHL